MTTKKAAEAIQAFKGFGPDWKCLDMQYRLGGTYTHDGKVVVCNSGFHSCEYPLDAFAYYPPVTDAGVSRYAIVEASGEIARHGDDSKIACAQLTIKAEMHIPDIVSHAIKWVLAQCKPANAEHATGDQSASSTTGDLSASSATGDRSAALTTGVAGSAEITPCDPGANMSAVAIATGEGGKARAPLGSAIVLCYRNDDGDLIHIRAGIAGRDIEPSAWYSLDARGEFVASEPLAAGVDK